MCYRCGQLCDDGDGVADGVAADVEVDVDGELRVAAFASARPVTPAPTAAARTAVRTSRRARVPVTDAMRLPPLRQCPGGSRLGPRLPKAWAAQPDDKPS
jgi:hypothetical protein